MMKYRQTQTPRKKKVSNEKATTTNKDMVLNRKRNIICGIKKETEKKK